MNDNKKKKIIILGAGPTAIGALYRIFQLHDKNLLDNFEVIVLEQESEVGGLARTITDSYGFSWDLGVHVIGTSKYADFSDFIYSEIIEWNTVKRVVKADMSHVLSQSNDTKQNFLQNYRNGNNYVTYPVQNSIPYFPKKLKESCLTDLDKLNSQLKTGTKNDSDIDQITKQNPKFDENFGEFSAKIFGLTIQSIFIRPYNEKVWTVKLEEMSCKWLEGRVPRIDTDQLRRRCNLSRKQLNDEDSHQQMFFRYPANLRGIGEMWKKLVTVKFSSEIFKYQRKVIKVDTVKKKVVAENRRTKTEENYNYFVLISTIPLTELIKLTPIRPLPQLRYSKIVLVGIGLRLPRTTLASQLSWAYYPRPEIIFYRSTVLSNFSLKLVPDSQFYWSVLCEIGMRPDEPITNKTEIISRTINDLVSVGMIISKKQVFSSWLQVLEYGYPIPTLDRDKILVKYHNLLEEKSIYSRGRFGGWKYEISNQDHSFQCGLQLIDKIFLNVPETLYIF